jgi:chromosomal replication initiation ATPase DnaA
MTDDNDIYRQMKDEYLVACEQQPFVNHCILAMIAGAKTYKVSVAKLQSRDRHREMTEIRQKVMAFARVVSITYETRPNSWKGIGRAFKRHHQTVMHSERKFGPEIRSAIEFGTIPHEVSMCSLPEGQR